MKTLVKKDIYLMKSYNILIIMMGTLLGFMNVQGNGTDVTQAGSLFSGILLITIPLSNLTKEEGKTKDIILKSLPIDRRAIVLSRYITMFIYIIFIFGITFISSYIFSFSYNPMVVGKPISLCGLLFNIIIVTIFIAIVLPVQYLKIRISSIINIIIYLSLVIIPFIISKINSNFVFAEVFTRIANRGFQISLIIYIPLGITLYYLSFLVSTKLYKSIDR